jgi:hypothetical protein
LQLEIFLGIEVVLPREQQKWVTKMLGYDYEIIYKKGKENVVVDALSRKYEEEGSLFSLSFLVPNWIAGGTSRMVNRCQDMHMIHQLQVNPHAHPSYTW